MKPLSIEIGELTPVWKWQTQISSDSRDMDFWGRRDSEPWDRGKFAWENAVTLDPAFAIWIPGHKKSYWLRMPKDPHKPNFIFQTRLVVEK